MAKKAAIVAATAVAIGGASWPSEIQPLVFSLASLIAFLGLGFRAPKI